jgi:outer membrane murein-binding lipoprotein Lpp
MDVNVVVFAVALGWCFLAMLLSWKLRSAQAERNEWWARYRSLQQSWDDLGEHFKSATARAEKAEAELRRLTDRDERGRSVRREP